MDQPEIYYGTRDQQFKDFIFGLLKRGKVKTKYIDSLLTKENIELYSQAFTAASANSEENYEIFEQLGDLSANKFIVGYMYNRFPFLKTPKGVKVVARLRINYGATQSFAKFAEKLGFWPFISCAEDGINHGCKYRSKNKKELLEDTFEAFIGCTEFILDNKYRIGVGYGIVYDILSSIFDEISISLAYEDLFDAKTRLKEIFDYFPDLGTYGFTNTRQEINQDNYTVNNCSLYAIPQGVSQKPFKKKTGPRPTDVIELPGENWIFICSSTATSKIQSQQKALY